MSVQKFRRIEHTVLESEHLMGSSYMLGPSEEGYKMPAHPRSITYKTVTDKEVLRLDRSGKHYIIIEINETIRESWNTP